MLHLETSMLVFALSNCHALHSNVPSSFNGIVDNTFFFILPCFSIVSRALEENVQDDGVQAVGNRIWTVV